MNFGKMDRRVTIEKSTVTRNSKNEAVHSWSTLVQVWAMKIEQSAKESWKSGTEQTQRKIIFIIRWRSDVSANNRVVFEGDVYDIIQEPREIGRKKGLELECVRREG